MPKSFVRKFLIVLLALFSIFGGFTASARAQVVSCPDVLTGLNKSQLEEAQVVCEKEIIIQENIISSKKREGVTYEGDIAILKAKIAKARLSIKAQNLLISSLAEDIGVKKNTIIKYSARIDRGRESLSALMRRTNELDSYSFTEVVFSEKPLSEFFADLDAFQYVGDAIDKSLEEVGVAKKITEEAKTTLEEKKNKEADLRYQKELEKKFLDSREAEKGRLLAFTKVQVKEYDKELKKKQARAASIRAALFALRDTGGIPFGKALEYANFASQKTGVRATLILAILTQESNLGKDQGSCLLSNIETGDGVGKNTGTLFERIMYSATNTKRPSDTVPFVDITKRLGTDWKTTPISCPPRAKYFIGRGFGGGMGPSQFIPSTWENFKKRIGALADVSADQANPWDPKHAIIATGIYMSGLGAKASSFTSERNAACRYYSGSNCQSGRKPANIFYGDQVMKLAETIQTTMIDPLENA